MRLEDLARGVPGAVLEGRGDAEVSGIAYDSRRVKTGDLFVAVTGIRADGHAFAADAVGAGAVAVAVERPVNLPPGTPVLKLPSTRSGLAEIAAEFYGRPSRHLYVAGVTGTDGKTTVTHMAEHVLMAGGMVAGAMSTVAFSVSGTETANTSGQTTTEAPQVQEWLRRMVDASVRCAVIEKLTRRSIPRRWSYGLTTAADLHPLELSMSATGSRFRLKTPLGETEVTLAVPARFNVYNALCAAGVCLAVGVPIEEIGPGLAGFDGVRGRLERVDLGQDFSVFIDFAHSAGALASALAELRPFTRGRLIAVFGSTARSDHDRPGMGKAAADLSDFFIITTDDPLREDPTEIARDVQSGVSGKAPGRDYDVVIDRRAAIRRAIEVARPGDTVLLAGKGHERTMQMAEGAEPWDERAEAEAAIKDKAGSR